MSKLPWIFLIGLIIALSMGCPKFFLTDEWISGNQLNHMIEGKNLLFGYEPYGDFNSSSSHKNVLGYTLAIPVFAYPIYQLFSLLQNFFRLFVILLFSFSVLVTISVIGLRYPKCPFWHNTYWRYGLIITSLAFIVLNLAFFQPFDFSRYGEVAALIFTNHIAFALLLVFVFVIFKDVFNSDYWGAFGVISVITSSSFLFWSGNAKDHMFTFLFLAISVYFFIRYIKNEDRVNLISSFITVGLLAWVRPDLGLSIFIGFVLALLVISHQYGLRYLLGSLGCCFSVLIGSIPLFVNNYLLTRNPLKLPWGIMTGSASVIGRSWYREMIALIQSMYMVYGPISGNLFSLYGIFICPGSISSAGIFQVSPLSAFAFLLVPLIVFKYLKKVDVSLTKKEIFIVFFMIVLIFSIFITYVQSLTWIPNNMGVIPDMRYFAPAYLPLLVLACFSLKQIGFNEDTVKLTLKSLIPLLIVELPLLLLMYHFLWGQSYPNQLIGNRIVVYLFLFVTMVIYILILLRKLDIKTIVLPLAVLMVSALSWEFIVDCWFCSGNGQGYSFWLPVVEKIWELLHSIQPIF